MKSFIFVGLIIIANAYNPAFVESNESTFLLLFIFSFIYEIRLDYLKYKKK